MMSKIKNIIVCIVVLCLYANNSSAQSCYPNKVVTAAYATGGSSTYKNNVLWLTWGSSNAATDPYGKHGQDLAVGSASYASIHLGGTDYLCIEAVITKIDGEPILSYAPGNYSDDRLDDLYNIGGVGSANKLINGIRNKNNGTYSKITLKCKATIAGEPVRLAGMVIADGESLAGNMDVRENIDRRTPNPNYGEPTGEYIYATAKGDWNLVNVDRSSRTSATATYYIRKEYSGTDHTIKFLGGGDNRVSVSAFLKFNENAYAPANNGFSVEFSTELKGGGLTALAIGLLTPQMDLGDAPASYGNPRHLLQNLTFTNDGITEVSSTASTTTKVNASVNINRDDYTPGALVSTQGSYLGNVAPDSESGNLASKYADGDDKNSAINDEDAWPTTQKRISAGIYKRGDKISVNIPYKGGKTGDKISGWIDFDLNGTFDESERLTATITANGNGSVNLTWSIPDNRRIKNTYVRLRYFDKVEDEKNPTSSVNYGEVEDHLIYILGPSRTNPMLPSKAKK